MRYIVDQGGIRKTIAIPIFFTKRLNLIFGLNLALYWLFLCGFPIKMAKNLWKCPSCYQTKIIFWVFFFSWTKSSYMGCAKILFTNYISQNWGVQTPPHPHPTGLPIISSKISQKWVLPPSLRIPLWLERLFGDRAKTRMLTYYEDKRVAPWL